MKDLKAIGIENQINDALFGPSDNQIKLVKQKIDFVKRNASKVIKVNGDKVYDVIIDEDNIRYNLLKCPAEFIQFMKQKYYYPIQYAHIEF
ncbi:MAG TPA: hypothetical protein DDX98_03485 [Bacteroidales bacterium]|jgi:hypothetical protein|nr:hypothetical protein [Bacteroidales bacterium]